MIKRRAFLCKFVRRRPFSSCPLPLEPQTPSFSSPASQITQNEMCFSLVEQLISRGLFSSAQKVIQRLISQCSSVSEVTSAADFAVSRGWVLHDKMVNSGLKPNIVTYQIMLNNYCRDQKVDCALMLLDDMLQHNIAPNVHCYTVLLSALCKEQRLEEVYSLYHKMLDSGVVPDHVLFFTLVKNHAEGDELYFALTVLQAIAKKSCNIDISTLSSSVNPKSTGDAMVEIEYLLEEIARSTSDLADMGYSIT
ncbi:UNVERIFIED_CONTAM: hypothetical protein Scaly_2973400 [Sesamum calycinum]|uniref:Pentatricopeptide repeat-containing protein n=1 Tax=Sesamum calycinum TaxID=2727403 RepID=A0AAW2KP05_9LAMI